MPGALLVKRKTNWNKLLSKKMIISIHRYYMKLAVIGGRNFNDKEKAYDEINKIRESYCIDTIVSGCARGADQIGIDYAEDHDLQIIRHPADWEKYGRAAGMIRNSYIIRDSDLVIAFWNGRSPGTKDSINKAKKKKIPVIIIYH